MNPWNLSASDLLVWGIVLHLIADWPLQNDWMANNKMLRRLRALRRGDGMMAPPRMYRPEDRWWDRHPAAYVHAGIHGVLLALIFGWVAIPLAIVHLLIDTRVPVVWWSKLIRQTQPIEGAQTIRGWREGDQYAYPSISIPWPPFAMSIGTEVRFWTDQVFHIACIAVAALLAS